MTINVIKPSNAMRTVFARKSAPFKFDPNMGNVQHMFFHVVLDTV